jgi:hypothetical protein
MLDELRNDSQEDDSFEFDFDNQDNVLPSEDGSVSRGSGLFLGMTPVERMFIAIFLFMNVTVLGLAFLLATHRIVF